MIERRAEPGTFAVADDGVDPAAVPTQRLRSGATIPAIGLGTFGSDRYSAAQVAEAVLGAAGVGYRHFDCAAVYGNEPQVGRSLRAILDGGVRREDLWITSKLWNDRHGDGQVAPPASVRSPTWGSTISTSTSSTGRSRTTIPRDAMWGRAAPTRGRTSTTNS